MGADDGVEEHESQVVPRRRDILKLGGLVPLARLSPVSNQEEKAALKGPPQNRATAPPRSRRAELYTLLGDLPSRTRRTTAAKRRQEERDGYMLETWDLDLNGIELVPAYPERWTLLRYDVAHQETPEGRQQIFAFLQRFM